MLAHPSGFVQCTACSALWQFAGEDAPAVGATPLDAPPLEKLVALVVKLASEEHITNLARAQAHGYGGFHIRSDAASFWRDVAKGIKYIEPWEADDEDAHKRRLEMASQGQSPRLPGGNLHDRTWIPEGPSDQGPSLDVIINAAPEKELMKFRHGMLIQVMARFCLDHGIGRERLTAMKAKHTWARDRIEFYEAVFGMKDPFSDEGEIGQVLRCPISLTQGQNIEKAARFLD